MDAARTDRRIAVLICGFATLYSVFALRLIQIQVWDQAKYANQARETRTLRVSLPAQRGNIRDVNGEILATNLPLQRVIVDGTRLSMVRPKDAPALPKNPSVAEQAQQAEVTVERVLDAIGGTLGLDPEKRALAASALLKSIPVKSVRGESEGTHPGSPYVVLQRRVSEADSLKLREIAEATKLRGLYFEPDTRRIYPNGSLLSHVVGFLNQDAQGIQGVERTMERYLSGQAGYRVIERDRAGNELGQYRGVEQQPRDGDDVVLTVDSAIQAIVEEELDAAVRKLQPDMAAVVMMRPRTGEIMAMASRPDFDPNALKADMGPEARNRAIADIIEPGSTFKIVAVGAALNEGKVKPETMIFCENGRWEFGGSLLHDSHPLGTLNVHDVVVHSSNIGSAKLAVQLGPRPFHRYIRAFGFGERTGIELPGEINGLVHPPERWSAISISRIPMGHEVGVTPLQMTTAMSVVANGGELVVPRVVHSIRDSKTGQPATTTERVVVRRVLSEQTAGQLRSALEEVVTRGTAKMAAVPGFRVAGKTGTAQKVDPKHGGYLKGQYVVSFVGYLPAENPEFVCLVTFDNAHLKANENFGGLVSAPVFSRIAARTAKHLGLQPTEPLPGVGAPKLAAGAKRD